MNPLELIAYLVVGAVGIVLVLMLKRQLAAAGFEARREAAELELLQTKLESTRLARARAKESVGPWNSWRKFRVAKKVHEGGDICSFYLAPHDRKPLPPFKPGQYLTFQLDGIPDQEKPAVRCYSLSDCYHPEYYRISVKRVPAPRDAPDAPPGLGSGFLHDHIEEGSLLDVGAPNGHFAIDPEESTPLVLVGGGIGVTPVLSMFNAIRQSSSPREVWFFYGVRHRAENILAGQLEELSQLSAEYPNLHFRVCFSEKLDDGKELKPYELDQTRVSVALMKSLLPSSNYEFYTCGPPPMMKAIAQDLRAWGVPAGNIHEEVFPGPKVASAGSEAKVQAGTVVEFRKSAKKVTAQKGCASLLELAESGKIDIPFACRVGSCGTCVTAVLNGAVAYDQDPSWKDEPTLAQEGLCLPCICLPKGELVIDR